MDRDQGKFIANESLRSSAPSISPIFATSCTDLWHSTPIKKKHVGPPAEVSSPPSTCTRHVSPEHSATCRPQQPKVTAAPAVPAAAAAGGAESAVVQKQRRELQLLMAELKDRDQELNAMVTAHHKQLQAWEQDRQRVLTLEQRSARLEGELQKRKEVIQALTQQLRIAEARQRDERAELSSAQLHLQQLSQQHQQSASHCQELEERSQSLNATILELSSQVGRLQAREEELTAMLSLKVCENQQNDLQLLQLNLESAQEALIQRGSQASPGSQGDLASLFLDCPALSPRSGRSPGLTNGPSPSRSSPRVVANGDVGAQQKTPDSALGGRLSPTSCLQRLLAKSQEMVASLELGSAHIPEDQTACSPSCGSAPSQGRQETPQVTTGHINCNLRSHSVLNHWNTRGSHFVDSSNKTV